MKRRLPPHIVLPNGQWRFVKRGSRAPTKRKRVVMARRRSFRRGRRYFSRARGRSKGGGGSVTKNAIDGIIVGIAQTALPDVMPMQDPLIALGVGWFRRNPTLMTLGGVQLGAQLGSMVGGAIGTGKSGVVSQV
jgi:uncharacterized protein (DUF2062 family)